MHSKDRCSDHTGVGFYQLSSQQHFQAALQSIIISQDYLQFLTTGCEKGTERSFFLTSMLEGPLPLPKGTRLSISTTGFSRLLFNPKIPGFHQSTSHKFRLLTTVFTVGVGLISRMTVLALLKHDIIP